MTSAELVRANGLADVLIGKLEQIKALWAEVPSVEELQEVGKEAASIAASLNEIREACNAKDFPCADDFDELDRRLGGVVSSLNEIIEKQGEVEG